MPKPLTTLESKSSPRRQNRLKLQAWCVSGIQPSLDEWTQSVEQSSILVRQHLLTMCAFLDWPAHLDVCLSQGAKMNESTSTNELNRYGFNMGNQETTHAKVLGNKNMTAFEIAIMSNHFGLALSLIKRGQLKEEKINNEVEAWNPVAHLCQLRIEYQSFDKKENIKDLVSLAEEMLKNGWDFNQKIRNSSGICLAICYKITPLVTLLWGAP